MNLQTKLFLPLLTLFATTTHAQSDYPYPALSPLGKISQQIGTTRVDVEYERPSVRKRTIFGELVPWNKVWRTGAGYCTKFRFSKDVIVEGQPVPAGQYSLFSIPAPERWIFMLNKDTTLYGSSFYKPQGDVARFVVIPTSSARHYETLTIDIDLIRNNGRVYLSWANTQVSFEVLTSTDEETMKFITENVASNRANEANLYAGAAEYLLYQHRDLSSALVFANRAIEMDKGSWAGGVRLSLYEQLGYYEEAEKAIAEAIEEVKKGRYEREKDRHDRIRELESTLARIKARQ